MTYLQFLMLFICLPLVVLALSVRNARKLDIATVLVLTLVAVIYTTPWDNYIVAKGIWSYGQDRVIATIGYVPIEEYSFFVLQTLLTGFWCVRTISSLPTTKPCFTKSLALWILGTLFLFCLGFFFLFKTQSFYMGLILCWGTPVLLLQLVLGGKYLHGNMIPFAKSVVLPTLYLWCCDYYAISNGIWTISEEFTFDFRVGVLPLEEMAFFLITNLMLVQGIMMSRLMRPHFPKLFGAFEPEKT